MENVLDLECDINSLRLDDLQFENLYIYQDPKGYCFTSDSVLLANYVKCSKTDVVVEFCAGTGVISILLSKKQNPKKIYSIELMKKYYQMLSHSVKYNKLEDKIVPVCMKLEDVCKEFGSGFADVVVCNPPYYPQNSKNIIKSAETAIATTEITTSLENVMESVGKVLKFGGKLFMVHRVDRLIDVVCEARKFKIEPKKLSLIYPKEDYEPVVFLMEAIKGGKPGLRVPKPTFANQLNKA